MHSYFRQIGLSELDKRLQAETDFYEAPASTRFHGAVKGGLASHSMAVAALLNRWTDRLGLVWKDKRSPLLIGLLHDICKIDTYEEYTDEDGNKRWRYKDTAIERDHGRRSVWLLEHTFGLKLTDEERACIHYHMGSWTKDIDESMGDLNYSQMLGQYHNLIWVHTADMYASQILEK